MSVRVYDVAPHVRPKLNRTDRFQSRPRDCVISYGEFKTRCARNAMVVPLQGCHVVFVVAMPAGWSAIKKGMLDMTPHEQAPPLDDFARGVLSAVCDNYAEVWDFRITKVWGHEGQIVIADGPEFDFSMLRLGGRG